MLTHWRLRYHEAPDITDCDSTDLGLVSADWLSGFVSRNCDLGAEVVPGPHGEHQLILERHPTNGRPARWFSYTNPRRALHAQDRA
jgi:hypothetical protein